MTNRERARQALRRWRDEEPEAAGLTVGVATLWGAMTAMLDAACAAAVAAERAACAEVADAFERDWAGQRGANGVKAYTARCLAMALRARTPPPGGGAGEGETR